MSQPAPDTLERERDQLYVTDAQLIRRMGVPEKLARALLREFSNPAKHPSFPRPQKAFGDRRYMPAVRAYFDRMNGLKSTG